MTQDVFPETMPPIPEVTLLQRAFPIASTLPEWPDVSSLPEEFRQGSHPACQAAQEMFYSGGKTMLETFTFYNRYEMTPEQGMAVLHLVHAHVGCYDYKHEDKMAGCGWLLDTWFRVVPTKGEK